MMYIYMMYDVLLVLRQLKIMEFLLLLLTNTDLIEHNNNYKGIVNKKILKRGNQ